MNFDLSLVTLIINRIDRLLAARIILGLSLQIIWGLNRLLADKIITDPTDPEKLSDDAWFAAIRSLQSTTTIVSFKHNCKLFLCPAL